MVQGEATALEATLRQLRLDQTKQAASTKQLAALTESGRLPHSSAEMQLEDEGRPTSC